MIRIHVVNPNTDAGMTRTIAEAARAVAGPDVVVDVERSDSGPASVESHYDEALAVPGVLRRIDQAEQTGADAHVIACFGDPGLLAAREIASGPVIGIAEAAMHQAVLVGRSFTVITSLSRTAGRAWDLAQAYGFASRCRRVRAVEIDVLAIADPASGAWDRLRAEAVAARDEDGADAIVLGCAGLAGLCRAIGEEVGIPVIDGVSAAVTLAEGLVRAGVRGSSRGEFAPPPPKPYTGGMAVFTRAGASDVTRGCALRQAVRVPAARLSGSSARGSSPSGSLRD
ncbi:MAG: Allantoin racemase [Pseudoclavibacter caeni]